MIGKTVLLLVGILTVSAPETVEARWKYNASKDPFTDEKASTAVKTNPGLFGASLIVRCKDGFLESYYHPGHYLGSDGSSFVRYRFNKDEVQSERWSMSTAGKAVFADYPAEFARQIITKSSLVIEAEDFSGEMQFARFSLAGSAGPVGRVMTDCAIMKRNPRQIDDLIWRRVVLDLDMRPKSTIRELSLLLDEIQPDSAPHGQRTGTKLYRKMSDFYVGFWLTCEKRTEFALKVKPCNDYLSALSSDNDADYPVEAIDLLIALLKVE